MKFQLNKTIWITLSTHVTAIAVTNEKSEERNLNKNCKEYYVFTIENSIKCDYGWLFLRRG